MRLRHTQFAWGRFLIWGHLPYLEHIEHLCGFYRSFSFKCQVYATFDNSDNVGPLGCAGRRRALQLHAHSRCARARHC